MWFLKSEKQKKKENAREIISEIIKNREKRKLKKSLAEQQVANLRKEAREELLNPRPSFLNKFGSGLKTGAKYGYKGMKKIAIGTSKAIINLEKQQRKKPAQFGFIYDDFFAPTKSKKKRRRRKPDQTITIVLDNQQKQPNLKQKETKSDFEDEWKRWF